MIPEIALSRSGYSKSSGAVLLATALLACWVPARRAARVEVVEALQGE